MAPDPGRAGGRPEVPAAAHIDPAGQLSFLRSKLLADAGFVRDGGAKFKVIVGATGAGKSHFLGALLAAAEEEGFRAVSVDAAVRLLGGFDLLYQAIADGLDFEDLARRFAARILEEAGYRGPGPTAAETLAEWAEARGHESRPLRVRWDEELHRRLQVNPDLDYGYASGLSRWCDRVLWGTPDEDGAPGGGLLEHWLRGGRLSVRECNRLRLRRPADRFTGRLWLRSLLYFIRMAGLPGLVVAVDGLGALAETGGRRAGPAGVPAPASAPGEAHGTGGTAWPEPAGAAAAPPPHYTKQRRDDLYECLRALIDDMGQMPGFLLVLAVPPALVDRDNLRTGFASYAALAERLKNEVETVELNRFADEVVLERLWAADPDAGRQLAERLLAALAPSAGEEVRRRALAAARAQWAVRDVTVSAVRRSVLAVLQASASAEGAEARGGGAAPPTTPATAHEEADR